MRSFVRTGLVAAGSMALACATFVGLGVTAASASGNCAAPPAAGVDYTGCDLTGVNFAYADLRNAILNSTNFTNANLTGVTLTGSQMFLTNLTGATLTGVRSGGVQGLGIVSTAQWKVVDGYLLGPGADLTSAVMRFDDLDSSNLHGANLAGADLTGSSFEPSDLSNANFTGAIMRGTNVAFSDVRGANFTNADLYGLVSNSTIGPPAALPDFYVMVQNMILGDGVNFTDSGLIPFPMSVFINKGTTAKVIWTLPVAGVFCDHLSKSKFPIGPTTVTCAYSTGPGHGAFGSFVVTVHNKPKITLQPKALSAHAGAIATFTAAATAYDAPTVQWQVSIDGQTYTNLTNGSGISGATTPSLQVIVPSTPAVQFFRAVFSNGVGSATTHGAKLTVN
jgi:uncharacterized protein YjbI with pentapeptide repeats